MIISKDVHFSRIVSLVSYLDVGTIVINRAKLLGGNIRIPTHKKNINQVVFDECKVHLSDIRTLSFHISIDQILLQNVTLSMGDNSHTEQEKDMISDVVSNTEAGADIILLTYLDIDAEDKNMDESTGTDPTETEDKVNLFAKS